MAFKEIVVKEKGEVTAAKVPHVTLTDGRKFVFNLAGANMVGNAEGLKAAVLYDEENGSVGFRFRKEAPCSVVVGQKTLTVKGTKEIREALPEILRIGKWSATVEWNKEAQVFEVRFGSATVAPKRGEKEAAKLAGMSEEKRVAYLEKKAERQAAERAKRAAAKAST